MSPTGRDLRLVPLLAAAVAAAAAATGMPATMLASIAGQDAEDALRRGGAA